MALSANTVLEVRNGGSDTNGGGFVTGASGTDQSLQDAKNTVGNNISSVIAVANGTTTITCADASFTSAIVGNIVYFQGGTGAITAQWRQVTVFTNATTITIDATIAASTGMTMNIGGALASPGQAGAIATVAGMITYVKYNASPYIATSASTNIAAGCVLGSNNTFYCGYDTTRSLYNTDANRPTFQVNTALGSATLFTGTNAIYKLLNFILDGQLNTSSRGSFHSGLHWRIKGINFTNGAMHCNSNTGTVLFCEATGCTTVSPFNPTTVCTAFCVAHDNTVSGFSTGAGNSYFHCIADSNTGATTDGFNNGGKFYGCVAYGNGRHGFNNINNNSDLVNCISEGNTSNGYAQNTVNSLLLNCASFNNSARTGGSGTFQDIGAITGSGSFFTNAAGGDFSLNNTAGAGALCRALGFPALFPDGLTANFMDVGAAQHQDSAVAAVEGLMGAQCT